MNDIQRERITKDALEIVREVWCDRQTDEPPFFNCDICEFTTTNGRCSLKIFLTTKHYMQECPQGHLVGGESDG